MSILRLLPPYYGFLVNFDIEKYDFYSFVLLIQDYFDYSKSFSFP